MGEGVIVEAFLRVARRMLDVCSPSLAAVGRCGCSRCRPPDRCAERPWPDRLGEWVLFAAWQNCRPGGGECLGYLPRHEVRPRVGRLVRDGVACLTPPRPR